MFILARLNQNIKQNIEMEVIKIKSTKFFLVICLLGISLSFILVFIYKGVLKSEIENYPPSPKEQGINISKGDEGYILREENGKLEIFIPKEKAPARTLDIFLDALPKGDRESLRAGIYAESYEELLGLIEDFGG